MDFMTSLCCSLMTLELPSMTRPHPLSLLFQVYRFTRPVGLDL